LSVGQQDYRLLTADDVAQMLGVTAAWVYEQSRRGRIPTVQLDQRIETLRTNEQDKKKQIRVLESEIKQARAELYALVALRKQIGSSNSTTE
jgi:predicted site-specific integrase-resolvase